MGVKVKLKGVYTEEELREVLGLVQSQNYETERSTEIDVYGQWNTYHIKYDELGDMEVTL